jgi:hypothetical protein
LFLVFSQPQPQLKPKPTKTKTKTKTLPRPKPSLPATKYNFLQGYLRPFKPLLLDKQCSNDDCALSSMASIAGTAADAEELMVCLRVELVYICVDCTRVRPWRPKVREFPEREGSALEQQEGEQQLVAEGSALGQSGCARMDLHLRWHVLRTRMLLR